MLAHRAMARAAAHYPRRPREFAPSPAQRSCRMSDNLSAILKTTTVERLTQAMRFVDTKSRRCIHE
jgi:hypothetical protein